MKGILITTDSQIFLAHLEEPLHKSIGSLVDGFIEIVRPINLERPYVMICNEDYIALDLPQNKIGSFLYGTHIHGHPVQGNIVIMKECGDELQGLDQIESIKIISILSEITAQQKGL